MKRLFILMFVALAYGLTSSNARADTPTIAVSPGGTGILDVSGTGWPADSFPIVGVENAGNDTVITEAGVYADSSGAFSTQETGLGCGFYVDVVAYALWHGNLYFSNAVENVWLSCPE
jgi:hypothetical protein